MSIFREIPPTAGLPLYFKDVIFKKGTEAGSLENDFKGYLHSAYTAITYSGTAALYLILESLKELSGKKRVVIPSYICPLVPLAVKRAGLEVEVCDIAEEGFNFNLAELEKICSGNNDILAIIPAHLGGIPLNFEPVEKLAKKYGIFTVEDCAQSLGAAYRGKRAGALGDFSFFSLCRGKGLTIYEGGVIVAHKEAHANLINRKIKELVKEDFFSEGMKVLELLGYALFYRPQLFWFVYQLPQLFWKLQGKSFKAAMEEFTPDFPIHAVSRIRKNIGRAAFSRLEGEINQQREKADYYIKGLQDIKGINVVKEPPNCRATYPYLTVLFDEPQARNRALRIFRNLGLGVSTIYLLAITEYPYLKGIVPEKICPAASALSQRHLTLSTSTFLKEKDLAFILERIKKVLV